ncbi:MAG: Hpt domain-containing protein [Thioalkalivibrionaceae bacterium]
MASSAYAWVRPELDGLFDELAQALEGLALDTTHGPPEGRRVDRLVHLLDQLRGTLVMLELVPMLRVLDEMSSTLRDVTRGQAPADAITGLVEVGLQLPDAVEALAGGVLSDDSHSQQMPLSNLSAWRLLNRLREARGKAPLNQAPIGIERWSQISPAGVDGVDVASSDKTVVEGDESTRSGANSAGDFASSDQRNAQDLLRQMRKARSRFQRALLTLMRQGGRTDAIDELVAVCDDLVRSMPHVDLRRLAWVSRALLESLRLGPERWTPDIKRLLGRVDRQLGLFLRRLEDRLRESALDVAAFPQSIYAVPAELVDQLLHLVTQPEFDTERTRELRAGIGFDVDGEVDPATVNDTSANLSTTQRTPPGRSVIEHLRRAIDDAWLEQRTRLETLLSLQRCDADELSSVAEGLERLADTITVAGDEATAETARQLAEKVLALGAAGSDAESNDLGASVAEASIELERAIQRFFAAPGHLRGGDASELVAADLSNTVFAEILRELGEVKLAALALFEGDAERVVPAYAAILGGLERVRGVLVLAAVEPLSLYVSRLHAAIEPCEPHDPIFRDESAVEAWAEALAVAEVAVESLVRPLLDLDTLIARGDELLGRFHNVRNQGVVADVTADTEGSDTRVELEVGGGELSTSDEHISEPGVSLESFSDGTAASSTGAAAEAEQHGPGVFGADSTEEITQQVASTETFDRGAASLKPSAPGADGSQSETTPAASDERKAEGGSASQIPSLSGDAESRPLPAFEFDREVLEGVALVSNDDPELQAEIVEVFVEEAEEASGRIAELWPIWVSERGDSATLTEMRRAFHTLKGSGRMAGALRLGEFAWAAEAFLNWLLRQGVSADDAMVAALDDARQTLPALIDEVRTPDDAAPGLRVPVLDIALRLQLLTLPSDTEDDDSAAIDDWSTASVETVSSSPSAEGESFYQKADHVHFGALPPESGGVEAGGADGLAPPVSEPGLSDDSQWVPALDSTLWSIFVDEAKVHLEVLEKALNASTIEPADPERDAEVAPCLDEAVLRAVHTLNGASRALNFPVLHAAGGPLERLLRALLGEGQVNEGRRAGVPSVSSGVPAGLPATMREWTGVVETVIHLPLETARQLHGMTDLSAGSAVIEGQSVAALAERFESMLSAWEAGTPSAEIESFEPTSLDNRAESDSDIDALAPLVSESSDPNVPVAPPITFEEQVHDDRGSNDDGADRELLSNEASGEFATSDRNDVLDSVASDDATSEVSVNIDDDLAVDRDASSSSSLHDADRHVPSLISTGEWIDQGGFNDAEAVDQKVDSSAENLESSPAIDAEFAEVFLEEAVDLLEAADRALRQWRETGALIAADAQSAFLREIHTLKGSARMAGFTRVGAIAHGIETAVAEEQRQFGAVREGLFEILDRGLGEIERLVRLGLVAEQTDTTQGGVLAALRAWPAPDLMTAGGEAVLVAERHATDHRASIDDSSVADTDPHERPELAGRSDDSPGGLDRVQTSAVTVAVEPQEQVRVPAQLLDTMVTEAGEILTYQRRIDQGVARVGSQLEELERTVTRLRQQLRSLEIETEAQILFRVDQTASAGVEFDPLEMDRYSGIQQLARALAESVNDLDNLKVEIAEGIQGSGMLLDQQARVVDDLQSQLASQRLVSFSRSVPRLRRVANQAAAEMGRTVDVRFEGAQVQLDRAVLDRLIGPLEHLLRNAMVHGIESPEEREASGKSRAGSLRISLRQNAGELQLDVYDDGRGIDPARVRRRAIEAGLLAPDVELRDDDAVSLILQPGFSTATEVTELAGRGVGLDVVHSEVKQLGGRLQIASKIGRGTQFQLRVPVSLTVTKALLVARNDHIVAIPVSGVEGVVRIKASELETDGQSRWFDSMGKTWQLFDLGGLLEPEHSSGAMFPLPDHPFPVLLVRDEGPIAAAVFVDSIRQSQEIVVKSVGAVLSRLPAVGGATLSADGDVHVIIDLPSLLRFQTQMRSAPLLPQDDAPQVPKVLVVDDSVTIRKVTTRVLERAGFAVVSARDGLEAVSMLDDAAPNLILLDVEMPRMDGFEFATHVRDHPDFSDLPIIMITSRTGAKHRERARRIGVNGYLGKPFLEHELLGEIRQWVGNGTPTNPARAEASEVRA